MGRSTEGQVDGVTVFGAGPFVGGGWLRLALDFVDFGGFGSFRFNLFNDFRGGSRGSGRSFFWLRMRGVDLLGDVGGGVEISRWPVERIEATELFELPVAGGDGAFGGGHVLAETGEAASGTGGGLVGTGEGDGTGASREDFVLDFDGDGLELVFEEVHSNAAEALAFPLAGGKAVDDLFFGMVARAELGHEGVEDAGVVDHGFAGEENGI